MHTNQHIAAADRGDWMGMLHELGRVASGATGLADGLDAAVEVMGSRLGCPLGFVYLVRDDGQLVCHSVWVADAGRRAMHPDPDRPVDFTLPRKALATGVGQWTDLDGSAEVEGPGRRAFAFPVLSLSGVAAVVELVGDDSSGKISRLGQDAHLIGVLLGRLAESEQIAEAVAHERRRIGRELHDSVGQQLSGLGMFARSLANRAPARWDEIRDQLDLLATGLKDAHVEVRTLSHGLTAGEDRRDGEGLASALASLAERAASQCGTACSFTGDATLEVDDPATANHLLRIAQEAVSNAVRHGHAHRVEVDLRRRQRDLMLQIRDDGRGIASGSPSSDGIGLANMKARAREAGGRLSIRSDARSGTVVTCSVPKGAH